MSHETGPNLLLSTTSERRLIVSHYAALFLAYAAALAGWHAACRSLPHLWPKDPNPTFDRPWLEVLWVLAAGLAVVAIGQAYTAGIRLPADGPLGPLAESINQAVIFSPIVALLIIRKQSPETAWIKRDAVPYRIALGLLLALVAMFVFTLARDGAWPIGSVVPRVYSYDNFPHLVQVFFEDMAIAMLVVRFRAATSAAVTIVAAALLFPVAHLPTILAESQLWTEYLYLIGDFALGLAVIAVALRARDIYWLWMVHFAMDMMQFADVSGAGMG